ncbi:MAG TPA: serine/threonine-protein kinase, partial [Byssovorax sp.]
MDPRSPEPREPSAASLKSVGKTIAGKYVLGRVLGEGGMGSVFEAEHVEIGKRVAIKIVRELRGQESEAGARFAREARAAAAVDSDHIVQVYDVGQDPELGLYMVMELLAGEDLGSLVARTGRLDATAALAIADQVAAGLEKAHAAGVVHRDMKPDNVFRKARDDGSAVVKLVDFGVAKVVREVRSAAAGGGGALTRSGAVLGSPCYMAPEQALGLPDVDHRVDIYGVGALLYELLTGARAFPEKATYEQTIVPILTSTAPRVSATLKTVSPAIDQLVADLMNPKPELRPQTMRDVRKRLAKIQPGVDEARIRVRLAPSSPGSSDSGSRAPRTGGAVVTDFSEASTIVAPPSRLRRRQRWLVMGGAMLFGGALAVIVFTWGFGRARVKAPDPPKAAAAMTAEPAPLASAAPSAPASAEVSSAPVASVAP